MIYIKLPKPSNKAMEILRFSIFFAISIIISVPHHGFSQETDKINSTSYLQDPNTVSSKNGIFKLGFFSPQNSTNRYLAIFHILISPNSVLWIANRDKPLNDSSPGKLFISPKGNLVLVNAQNETLWSTNTNPSSPMAAQIQDSGNLVLYEETTGSVLWDSFSNPADVWIPANKLVDDTNTGFRIRLSSWKNDSNPSVGDFTTGLQALKIPEFFIWNRDRPYYRTGPWNGQIFLGMEALYKTAYSNGLRVTEVSPGNFYLSAAPDRFFTKYTILPSGSVEKTIWDDQKKSWDHMWTVPSNECDVYGKCGPFGICNLEKRRTDDKLCSCLKGFVPSNKEEWDRGNWTNGCVRRTQLQCNNSNDNSVGNNDGFFRMRYVKIPNFAEPFRSSNIEECRVRCLRNCSCIAYAHDSNNIGCMFWWESDKLIDNQQFQGVGVDLYIRLASSEIEGDGKQRLLVIVFSVIGGLVLISTVIIIAWRRMANGRGSRIKGSKEGLPLSDSMAVVLQDEEKSIQIEELTLFSFETLANATERFHDRNMLGEGGFGHVYKGKLDDGREIAVKRLSKRSWQGSDEFMNEMAVISRLQHRNLVRLMGCCVEGEEKMLVYEYVANKSLDICLFDSEEGPSKEIREWRTRFKIIEGIGRGLLYLHRDSRVRIIHRDLKPSNVLLDEEWNPKISDFGMARVFKSAQDQENTARVVGTYGYMSPEYALEGIFSEKSDVYSFGVLVLEIISGKKNAHFRSNEWPESILGCAWKLWKEGRGLDFVDRNIRKNEGFEEEMVRCIRIALLCVQEFSKDRPTIKSVLSMLIGEAVDLPAPERPVLEDKFIHFNIGSTRPVEYSINQVTVSMLHG